MKAKPAVLAFWGKTMGTFAPPVSHLCSAEQHRNESQVALELSVDSHVVLNLLYFLPPGVVGSRSFPTLRWNTDFSGYKTLEILKHKNNWVLLGAPANSRFGGRIVVFLTIRMFSGKISADGKS